MLRLHTESKQCTQANDYAIADALIQSCLHHIVVAVAVVEFMLAAAKVY